MLYSYGKARFQVEDVFLNVNPTKDQIKKLEDLCLVGDFRPANYYDHDNSLGFSNFEEYDVIINFFKKVLNIIPDFEANVEIVDTTEDTYWTLSIKNGQIEECFGTVFWGTEEEKQKIFKVLEARLKGEKETIKDITNQIVRAIKGEFDAVDDKEEKE